jgi:hypothetical protein
MPRFPKRLVVLGLAAGGAAFARKRRAARTAAPAPSASAPTPPPAPAAPAPPVASTGATAQAPIVAPPPVEAPGPSVTPPQAAPGSETERAERVEATTPDSELLRNRTGTRSSVDELVERETAAAAAEAGSIGGPHLDDAHGDQAFEAVYEAGGGESEGFELAEEQLIENASHGDGRAEPMSDAFTPERESDEATARDGEPDEEKVSEVVVDPTEDTDDDPGVGPGITHDR